jgi:hypothetical protein
MIPPTSIDGTDITGATIDGTDVQEITVDGDTVFTAGPGLNDLVAPGNLIAWYPMQDTNNDTSIAVDETKSGGLLDTAGITVGDSSDYSASTGGNVSYDANEGVFDFDSGSIDSGSYEFTPSNGRLVNTSLQYPATEVTKMAWVYRRNDDEWRIIANANTPTMYISLVTGSTNRYRANTFTGSSDKYGNNFFTSTSHNLNEWNHYAYSISDSNNRGRFYINGTLEKTFSDSGSINLDDSIVIGNTRDFVASASGFMDDVRVYDKELTTSEVQQIYDNTQP